ncbi:hypothetical protein JDV02_002254 [Purpureocillium takamizusanense]|uniref:N-acetyltransferase domain-containing protein n=1 Tax=Purpureocillium takamizusanense TaxID=2060973 RepID=A0A9Q8QAP3_9HYPO|nr:uncharacterized protein JDV02_002254 [Purpureocillium takamizusanense]UNI15748.1 hypothetical protein JDV02_002254 [Purpureocillium takamizusanense]
MDADEIQTPRLLLKQLHTNDEGSQDLDWYHRLWSNELATQWSYRGACKTKADSQQWMAGVLSRNATGNKVKTAFAVLPRTTELQSTAPEAVMGIVTLLSSTFRLPSEPAADPEDDGSVVELGYLFHPDSWGHGYATESLRGFLDAYVRQRTARRGSTARPFEIRASAHSDNGASIRVLEKLGFEELGRFEHEGRLPLRKESSKDVVVHLRLRK